MTIGFKANNDGSGAIQVNGVDRATVDTSGNFGIGTSTPQDLLELSKLGGAYLRLSNPDTTNTNEALGGIKFYSADASGSQNIVRTVIESYADSVGATSDLRISTTPSGAGSTPVERMRIAADGQQSSVIPGGSTLYPEYKCRAWVNFNGTGTVAIRASGNVSSITDNGVGDYTVNFTTAMPDVNYAAIGTNGAANTGSRVLHNTTFSSGSLRVQATNGAGTLGDYDTISVAIFR